MKISLNRNQLKYIVIIAMLIDHAAWAFVDECSLPGQVMHFIGRLTGPTMAYFVYEGYIHTHNIKKYLLRMGIFAVISWPAFSLFAKGSWPTPYFGVIYTLFLGLLAIYVWDRKELNSVYKYAIIIFLCILSLNGDWQIFDVIWPLILFIYRDDPKEQFYRNVYIACVVTFTGLISSSPVSSGLYNFGIITVPFILRYCYNGLAGSSTKFNKWFFYVFYPAHLLVLYVIKSYIL